MPIHNPDIQPSLDAFYVLKSGDIMTGSLSTPLLIHQPTYTITGSEAIGSTFWNSVEGTLSTKLSTQVTLDHGRELHFYGKAVGDIANGDLCQFAGVQGDHILIKKCVAAEVIANPFILIGPATESFTNGNFGRTTWFGKINGVYTKTPLNGDSVDWVAGDELYFSNSTGQLTKTAPNAPEISILVGYVIKAQTGSSENGIIEVAQEYGQSLGDLNDVDGSAPTVTGQLLSWNQTSGVWQRSAYNITNYLPLTGGTLTGGLTIQPLVDTTTALVVNDKDSNNVLTVDTINNRVGIGTATPDLGLVVRKGSTGFPEKSGTTQTNGILRVNPSTTSGTLDFGVKESGLGAWIQSTNIGNLATNYPLLLNPNGGNVGIGTTTPNTRFHLAGTTSAHYAQIDTGINLYQVVEATAPTATLVNEVGNVDAGNHRYYVSFVTALGETAAPTGGAGTSNTVTTDAANGKVNITGIPVSSDYRVTARKVYRTIASNVPNGPLYHFKLLTTINDNTTTTYQDNVSDANLTGGVAYPGYWYQENTTNKMLLVGGTQALYVGKASTTLGYGAGVLLSPPAFFNTLVGASAGTKLTTPNQNTFVGHAAGINVVTGNSNILMGAYSAYGLSGDAQQNVIIGVYSAYTATNTGDYNVIVGNQICNQGVLGTANVYVGYGAGYNSSGSSNIFIGFNSGHYETGSSKFYVDNSTRTNEATARTGALLYGVMNTTVASQTLTANGHFGVNVVPSNATAEIVNIEDVVGLSIRANASQTKNLQEWQNSSGTVLLNVEPDGELVLPQDSKAIWLGAGKDMSIYYDGTSGYIKTSEVAASDLHIACGTDKTVVLDETVWVDLDFPIIIRTTGTGIPSLQTLSGNITAPRWAVNDFNVCEGQELIHEWKEGSALNFHVHIVTNGLDATDRYLKFEVEMTWANLDGVLAGTTLTSGELLIPANTTDRTHKLYTISAYTPSAGKIGGHVWARLKRIAAAGTAPTNDPFCSMLQAHIEKDTLGSRQIGTK